MRRYAAARSSMFIQYSLQRRIYLDFPLQLALNLVLLKNISIVGIFWGRYNSVEPERVRQVWKDLFACVLDEGAVTPRFFRLTPHVEITEWRVADAWCSP